MDVFAYSDYRQVIRALIEAKPKRGYGQLSRLASHTGINPTYMSQVLGGTKNLTEDQGYLACEFFELNEKETVYFLLLIQRERSGSHAVKKLLDREIANRQREAQKVKNRITLEKELSPEAQAIFYSDWMFTAIHALTSIKEFQDVDAIATHLAVPRSKVVQAVSWLLQHGLCKEESGRLVVGPSTTFVDRDSPLANRHHSNWRLKAIEKMGQAREEDFFFTAPFTVSNEDYSKIRAELVRLIDGIAKRVSKSEPESMATINLDLFKV